MKILENHVRHDQNFKCHVSAQVTANVVEFSKFTFPSCSYMEQKNWEEQVRGFRGKSVQEVVKCGPYILIVTV